MKFFAATAALALAASSVSAAPCGGADLTGNSALATLIAPATACQAKTGYTIIVATALPTADDLKKICSQCTDLLAAAKGVKFPTCTLDIGGTPTGIDVLFNSVAGKCGGAAAGNASNETAPATTTAAPASTTVAPASTTAAPKADGSNGASDGSKGKSEDIVAPTQTTAKPAATTPKPTSAGVSATLGAAVAVACSIAAFVL